MKLRIPTALLALTFGFIGIGTAQASLGNTVTTGAAAVGSTQPLSTSGSLTGSVGVGGTVNSSNSKQDQNSVASVNAHGDAPTVTAAASVTTSASANNMEQAVSSEGTKADKLESFSVSRKDLHTAGLKGNVNSSENSTIADFKSAVVSAMHNDVNIKNVSADDATGLLLQYQEPVRIFGLIPSHIVAIIQVTSDDTVVVHYPWYGFLMSGKRSAADLMDELTTKLATPRSGSAAAQTNSVTAQGNGSGSVTTNDKSSWTDRLERILEVLKGDSSVTSSSSAGGSY